MLRPGPASATSWRTGLIAVAVAAAVVAIVWVLLGERERERAAEREQIGTMTEWNRHLREQRERRNRRVPIPAGVPGGVPGRVGQQDVERIGQPLIGHPSTLTETVLAQTQIDCYGESEFEMGRPGAVDGPRIAHKDWFYSPPLVHDFDRDGELDVARIAPAQPRQLWYRRGRKGGFGKVEVRTLPDLSALAALSGDLLAVIEQEDSRERCVLKVERYRAEGRGLAPVEQWSLELPKQCGDVLDVRGFDIDEDGGPELIVHRGSRLDVFEPPSREPSSTIDFNERCNRPIYAGLPTGEWLIVDLDGDARPEHVYSGQAGMVVLSPDRPGELECLQSDVTTCQDGSALAADLDGDGRKEVWWRCQGALHRWNPRADGSLEHVGIYRVHGRDVVQVVAANLDEDLADELLVLDFNNTEEFLEGLLFMEVIEQGEAGVDVVSSTHVHAFAEILSVERRSGIPRINLQLAIDVWMTLGWLERRECVVPEWRNR